MGDGTREYFESNAAIRSDMAIRIDGRRLGAVCASGVSFCGSVGTNESSSIASKSIINPQSCLQMLAVLKRCRVVIARRVVVLADACGA